MPKQRSTLSKQHSTLLLQTATISNEFIVKLCPFDKVETNSTHFICRKDEIGFDIVAENGNNVEATFDIVERIVQLVAFDNVAWTLLLVWTWLHCGSRNACVTYTYRAAVDKISTDVMRRAVPLR